MFDFANLLFSGPCNARCSFCIGKQIDPRLNRDNLRQFPPTNLDLFIDLVRRESIRQVVLTGTNTDPQLYAHEAELLELLRQRLPPGTQISLHSNGRLALRKLDLLNQYDRAAISFPSFNPETYRRLMGVPNPPDIGQIISLAHVPLKVSCVVHPMNVGEISEFLRGCWHRGVSRLVLRKLYGDRRAWDRIIPLQRLGLEFQLVYRGNPVYQFRGMEVTLWDFCQSSCTSLNLFSNGQISREYLLAANGQPQSFTPNHRPSPSLHL